MREPHISADRTAFVQRGRKSKVVGALVTALLAIGAGGDQARAGQEPHLIRPLGGGAHPSELATASSRKVDFDLMEAERRYRAHRASSDAPFDPAHSSLRIHDGAVVVDAVATGDGRTLLADLEALGLRHGEAYRHVVSGWMPLDSIGAMQDLASLRFVRPSYTITQVGDTTTQGDEAVLADAIRTGLGVDGTGIVVGTVSSSYDAASSAPTDAADDVASGDLPSGVVVLEDPASGSDEGRAMMQIIHDVAPGADLAFHTGIGGAADFANAISDLIAQGSNIIVDDVVDQFEPMFQDGPMAQAVDDAVDQGVAVISAAGNQASQSYDAPFRGSGASVAGVAGEAHDFDPGAGVDLYQQVTLPAGQTDFALQWAEPYASATGGSGSPSDLTICIYDDPPGSSPVACSAQSNSGADPADRISDTLGSSTTRNLAIVRLSGPDPSLIKYVYFNGDATIDEYATDSPTIYGHANAAGSIAVGAAFYFETPQFDEDPALPEEFTSVGGVPILFDLADGTINEIRDKPEIVGPDGVNTTFFGSDIGDPGDGSDVDSFPNFVGTSASAPHLAGIAALLLEEFPALSPDSMSTVLQAGAEDMGSAGFDFVTGAGFVNASNSFDLVVFTDGFESGDTTRWSDEQP